MKQTQPSAGGAILRVAKGLFDGDSTGTLRGLLGDS